MAARVLMLFAFTSLFAIAWSSDKPQAGVTGLVKKASTITGATPTETTTLSDEPDDMSQVVERVVPPMSDELHESTIPAVTVSTATKRDQLDVWNCPFPEGITPGSYRVVDQLGRTGWLLLTLDDLTSRGMLAGTDSFDMYVSRDGESTWYFIRVEPRAVIATAPEDSTTLR